MLERCRTSGVGREGARDLGRWLAVGQSRDSSPRSAGAEAARAAVLRANADLVVVFCSDAYDLDKLQAGISEVSGDTPLIGCSTAGEIASSGPGDATVVVAALGGGFEVETSVATGASGCLRDAGATAASCMNALA